MNKKGAVNWALIAILVVAAVLIIGPDKLGIGGKTGTTTAQPGQPVSGCTLDTAPQITMVAVDAYNRNTAVTPDYTLYIANGADGGAPDAKSGKNFIKSSDVASPLDVQYGKQYIVLANESATYYEGRLVGEGVCVPTTPKEMKMAKYGALTATFFNENDAASTAQTIGAGETVVPSVKLKASTDVCFGNPSAADVNPNAKLVMGFNYNTSLISDVVVKGATKIDVPSSLVALGYDKAYQLAEASLCDLKSVEYDIEVTAKASMNPGANDNIDVITADPEIFVIGTGDDAGLITADVESDADVDVGFSNLASSALIDLA